MAFMILGIGFALLPLLLRLALKLRLGLPMLYILLMLTIFHGWYQANAALADGILFAMVGVAALSWAVTLARRLWELLEDLRYEWSAAKAFAGRVRQARASGTTPSARKVYCVDFTAPPCYNEGTDSNGRRWISERFHTQRPVVFPVRAELRPLHHAPGRALRRVRQWESILQNRPVQSGTRGRGVLLRVSPLSLRKVQEI